MEATLASNAPKSGISRFKSSRQGVPRNASATGSMSVAGIAIPQGDVPSVQRAVRTGKLQDGKLIGGGEGTSASEDEDDGHSRKALIELLRRGDPAEILVAMHSSKPGKVAASESHPVLGASDVDGVSSSSFSRPESRVRLSKDGEKISLRGRTYPEESAPSSINTESKDPPVTRTIESFPLKPSKIILAPSVSILFSSSIYILPTHSSLPKEQVAKNVMISSTEPMNRSVVIPSALPAGPGAASQSLPSVVVESPSFPRRNLGQTTKATNPVVGDVVENVGPNIFRSRTAASEAVKRKVSRFKAERC